VDGSLRTLTCVVVIPSNDSAVGSWVGWASVLAGSGNEPGDKVAVMIKSVGVAELGDDKLKPQPEANIATIVMKEKNLFTCQL
jgi:hypothetical protein